MAEKADYLGEKKLEDEKDRFALVVGTAQRARQLNAGAPPLVNLETEKSIVTALEEFVSQKIQIDWTKDKLPEKKRFT